VIKENEWPDHASLSGWEYSPNLESAELAPSTLFVRRMSDATANNKIAPPGNSDNSVSSSCKFLRNSNKTAPAHFGICIALTPLHEPIPAAKNKLERKEFMSLGKPIVELQLWVRE
jgi:hypothetical protein